MLKNFTSKFFYLLSGTALYLIVMFMFPMPTNALDECFIPGDGSYLCAAGESCNCDASNCYGCSSDDGGGGCQINPKTGNCWTCFPAGTDVEMEGGESKNIEDVVVGDKVVSQSEEGQKSVSTVTKLDQPIRDHMCQINYTDGEVLRLTDEHPLFTKEYGWKSINPENSYKDVPSLPVAALQKGDMVSKSDGSEAEVDYFGCWSEKVQTYNLILDGGVNTYFAEGYLAHNKGGGVPDEYGSCPAGTVLDYVTPRNLLGWVRGSFCRLSGGEHGPGFWPAICNWDPWCEQVTGWDDTYCSNCWCYQAYCKSTIPECSINLTPSSSTIEIDNTISLTASITTPIGTVERVGFGSGSSSIVSVLPTYDYRAVYRTVARGNSSGSTLIWANVYMEGSIRCTDFSTVTVPQNLYAWWQVKDGDVVTNGSISSKVPPSNVLIDDGVGGFPGIPIFANSLNTNSNPISSKAWSANTQTSVERLFDYSYFENLVPEDVEFIDPSTTPLDSGGVEFYGYYWYKATTGLTISSDIDLGDRKVILFVEGGDLNINGRINLDDGSGFFMAISDDNISVNPAVTGTPSLEGLYVTDGIFSTGDGGTEQLHIRGSVAGFGGIDLAPGIDLTPGRDLGDGNTIPAELFEYAPDQILLFPSKLASRRTRWNEIAP